MLGKAAKLCCPCLSVLLNILNTPAESVLLYGEKVIFILLTEK